MRKKLARLWDYFWIEWIHEGPKCPVHGEWPWKYEDLKVPCNCYRRWALKRDREDRDAAERAREARIQEIAEAIRRAKISL